MPSNMSHICLSDVESNWVWENKLSPQKDTDQFALCEYNYSCDKHIKSGCNGNEKSQLFTSFEYV